MKARCDSGTDPAYQDVEYDPRWADFKAFLADVGPRPEGTTLDRIDAAGGYNKENTRWADKFTQANNKKKSEIISYDIRFSGKRASAAEWARFLREMTGNPDWTAKRFQTCLKLMTIDQLIAGVHPSGIDPQELAERAEVDHLLGMVDRSVIVSHKHWKIQNDEPESE
ncbi:MAG TPA: hypothetical protein VFA99_14585 [Acidobacteriaceae bacterium]|nr:hypothetical protein [Acidobacteriaceae bacterium]